MQNNTNKKIDIGLAIRQKMSEHGTTLAWLARRINCDKGNLHRHLQHTHIHPELLKKISTVLKTDFFRFKKKRK